MNRENCAKLADYIEQHRVRGLFFNMSSYIGTLRGPRGGKCGTTACIAGFGYHLVNELEKPCEKYPNDDFAWSGHMHDQTQKFLDLLDYEAEELLYASGADCSMEDIPEEVAIKVLRNMAQTGCIEWYRILKEHNDAQG